MISIAVQGYGIVIWDGDGEWRTFTPSDSMSANGSCAHVPTTGCQLLPAFAVRHSIEPPAHPCDDPTKPTDADAKRTIVVPEGTETVDQCRPPSLVRCTSSPISA